MKYQPAPLSPSLAALPQRAPTSFRDRLLTSHSGAPLSRHASIACRLLESLASLFPSPFLYFQSFAASFRKTRGVWGTVFLCDTSAHSRRTPEVCTHAPFPFFTSHQSRVTSHVPVSTFRINTCKSVSNQMTLTTFRMNTYAKQGGGVLTAKVGDANRKDTVSYRERC
jgi:hypothetical protein